MFDPKEIQRILEQGRVEKWPYPRLFDRLKEAGITSYEVVLNPFQITYKGGKKEWHEPISAPVLQVKAIFNPHEVISAIRRNQKKETDYPTFLQEIAQAGVHHYRVDMAERTVSYFGSNQTQCHVEKVPLKLKPKEN